MSISVINGDCREVLRTLAPDSIDCIVTSPPYFGLRDYGVEGQIGLEGLPSHFVASMVSVFSECKRLLKPSGNLWINMGDCYSAGGRGGGNKQTTNAGSITGRKDTPGFAAKQLLGIPWRMAFALQDDGWFLREDIIWSKPNCMPESVKDRCTRSHEFIFHLTKSPIYYFDSDAIAEPAIYAGIVGMDETGFKDATSYAGKHKRSDKQRGHGRRHAGFNDRWDKMSKEQQCSGKRNKRSVWTIPVSGYDGAHFATFPTDLIEPCIKAGCPEGGTVLDPFGGAGTTGLVADRLGRSAILIELNPEYAAMARNRISDDAGMFSKVTAA